jgi:RNA polymerase sigma-70 factor, ECF subfamily
MAKMRAALDKLPADQREAIIVVRASGFSFEEAAEVCLAAVGTIKSLMNQAWAKLAALLHLEPVQQDEFDSNISVIRQTTQRN